MRTLPSVILTRRSLGRAAAAGAGAALLAGCGFALRQPLSYPFSSVYLELPAHSTLRPALTRALSFNTPVRVLPASGDPQAAEVVLEIPVESREKVVAGVNAAGQVREFLLRQRMRFRLRTPQGLELIPLTELVLERELGYAESAALAKEDEEALLFRDMRQDMVQQILRRLAALKGLNGPAPLSVR